MKNNVPKTHLFTEQDLHLYEIQNIYSACSLWLENNMQNQIATYDLIVRELPKNRNFLLFGGLEEIIEGIRKWRYTKDDIAYLKQIGFTTPKLEKYLKNFRFTGDLHAMPEGTAFFANEPVLRLTAPICEGNLLTMFLINALTSNTIFLSKVIRTVLATADKKLIAGGGMRSHSFESAMKGTRAGYLAGANSGYPAFCRKYNLPAPPISINAYHAVIKSFPNELKAFEQAAKLFPGNSRPMVDTYDFKQGIKNLIEVSKHHKIAAITIDSGNLHQRACYAKKLFDQAGLSHIKIILASNLDEYKIADLIKKKTPADSFLAVTEIATSSDAPKLEAVFKLAELRDGKNIRYTAKLAKGKISYPAKKQVFRIGKKIFQKDIIGLTDEKLGQPLLLKMISQGKIRYQLPTLPEIKNYVKSQVDSLPKKLLAVNQQHSYPVKISKNLRQLFEKVKKEELKKV